MFKQKEFISETQNEHGTVLLEWALAAFGLIVGFVMFVDLANMLNCYLVVSQVAYEGAKTGGNYPEIEAQSAMNLAPTAQEEDECLRGLDPASGFPCGHYFVQQRVLSAFTIARRNTYWNPLVRGSTLTTRFIAPGETGLDIDNSVIVSFSVAFNGFIFRQFPVSATIEGPYMMQE